MFLDRTRQLIVTLLDKHMILVHVPLAYGGRTMVQHMRGRNISIVQACMQELLAPPWDTVNFGLL